MKIVKKNQCLLGKTDYFFASIIKKKKDILDGGGERKEIPKLSKFSKFLTRIQTKKVTNKLSVYSETIYFNLITIRFFLTWKWQSTIRFL